MKIFDPKLTGSIEIQNTITGNVTIAGGLTVEGSLGGGITGSATASYVEYSNIANKPTLLSGSAQIASDISGSFTSLSSSLASELLKNTTDTLDGNLTVTGTITAQEFHTEFVSASIIYESGSTQFGNSSDDTHIFSGSALVSGSIGIGTSSPDNGLHVKDTNIHLQASNAKIKLSDFDNSMYLRMNNTGSLEITDSNEVNLVHFNKEGKVGIGTNSPAELLHLYSVSNSGPEIRFQHPSGSHYIRAYDNNWNFLADASVQAISIQNNGTTTFGANVLLGNTVVNPATGFADQTGIGLKDSTTVPKIEISSDDTALTVGRTTTGGAGVIADFRYESNVRHSFGTATSYMLGNIGIGTSSPGSITSGGSILTLGTNGSLVTDDVVGAITFKTNDASFTAYHADGIYAQISSHADNANGASGRLSFYTAYGSDRGERMRITSLGSVGIGTTSLSNKVHIVGPTLTTNSETTYPLWLSDTGDTTKALLLGFDLANDAGVIQAVDQAVTWKNILLAPTAGKVGIGSSSPSGTLDVQTSNSAGVARISADGNGAVYSANGDVQLYTNNAAYSTNIYSANKGSLLFRVQNDGNVGIGTTSAETHLDVVSGGHTKLQVRTTGVADASIQILGYDAGVHIGDAANGLRWAMWNDGPSTDSTLSFGSYALGSWYVPGSQVLSLKSNGNVGIGETTPDNTLHIKTSNAGGPQIELESTQGTANSAFINFDSTNLQLSTARDMVSGAWHDTSKSWGGITIEGGSAGSRIYFATAAAANTSPTTRMNITKDGNVLIGGGSEYSGTGVTSLTINNDSYPALSLGSTSGVRMALLAYNTYNYLSSSNPFFFDTGKVGIGTTSASSVLQVHGNQKWYTTNSDGNELRGWFVVGGSADPSNLRLYDANATDYWISLHGDGRIYSKGLVTNYGTGTGTYTQTTYYHDTSNGLLFEGGRTTNSSTGTGITWKFTWRGGAGTGGGVQLVHGDSAWTALSSDERLKTKTADVENGLDAITALTPIKYKWNNDIGSESEREITGFTAQNVQSAIPDAVFASSQDEELGDILTYRESYITAYLVKAVQELKAENDTLKARIEALEG